MADYKDKTLEELKALPEYQEVEGRSSMSKDELVAALEARGSDSEASDQETKGDSESFDAAQASVEEGKKLEDELQREDEEEQDSEREPKTESQARAKDIAGEDISPQDSGFASEASDPQNPDVRSNVSDAAVLDALDDEEAALADIALDASGPLKLESPHERQMVGAQTPEEAELQLERTKDLPAEYVGHIRADGTAVGRESKQGSGEGGKILQEDVIDFPPPLGEAEEGAKNRDENLRARDPQMSTEFEKSRAASEVFPDEGEQVAQDRLYQQRGQFYTDGVSGQADHNLAMAYRVHSLRSGNYHVNPDESARHGEREQLEEERVLGEKEASRKKAKEEAKASSDSSKDSSSSEEKSAKE